MLKEYFRERAALVERELNRLVPVAGYPELIYESMRYSLFAGGKRLRPILLMAAADAVGGTGESYLHMACALEMIHTYSLIHDDLPAMDNDDFRRGKPTCHKVYGEAMAILAGDGLLTTAFEVMLSQPGVDHELIVAVSRDFANAAGARGMVGGQVVDMLATGQSLDAKTLKFMHQAKTGALFKAAVKNGAILAGATPRQVLLLSEYAEQFGLAFQITDDILDVVGNQVKIGKPVGSDSKNGKVTYVTLYSLDGAQKMAREAVEQAETALAEFGEKSAVLKELVRYLVTRDS